MKKKSLSEIAGKKVVSFTIFFVTTFLLSAFGIQQASDTETVFLKATNALRDRGDRYMEQGFPLQANYYYSQAIVAVESFRQVVYDIYSFRRDDYYKRKKQEIEEALKKIREEEEEDDDTRDLITDDGGWFEALDKLEEFNEELKMLNEKLAPVVARYDSIEKARYEIENNPYDLLATYSIVSPYPYFFEGLVAELKGNYTKASECYAAAFFNPELPRGKLNFNFLLTMSSGEMAALYARLEQKEIEYGKFYKPESIGYRRDALNFSDLYLRDVANKTLETDSTAYGDALTHYKAALAANPFDGGNFAGCAFLSALVGDTIGAANYINNGLLIEPEHIGLNNLLKAWKGGLE